MRGPEFKDRRTTRSAPLLRLPAMPDSESAYHLPTDAPSAVLREDAIEFGFIGTLQKLNCPARCRSTSARW